MTQLDRDRDEIDRIDAQIAELFEKRFRTVEDVIRYKQENHLSILNQGREDTITEKNAARIQSSDIRPYFIKMYKEILSLSRKYQQEILNRKEEGSL
jgi:chorismate mutase